MNLARPVTVAATVLCLCLALHASPAPPPAPAPATASGFDRCINLFMDANGILNVNNHCAFAIRAMWFFGTGNQGSWTLGPNQSTSTGNDQGDIQRRGNIRYYACPMQYPHFRDASGRGISTPVATYHCEADQ